MIRNFFLMALMLASAAARPLGDPQAAAGRELLDATTLAPAASKAAAAVLVGPPKGAAIPTDKPAGSPAITFGLPGPFFTKLGVVINTREPVVPVIKMGFSAPARVDARTGAPLAEAATAESAEVASGAAAEKGAAAEDSAAAEKGAAAENDAAAEKKDAAEDKTEGADDKDAKEEDDGPIEVPEFIEANTDIELN